MRKSFFLVPLLALAMSSCSSDEPAIGGGETPDAQDGFYATVRFKLPTAGSRATEANHPDGIEEGQDVENNISSILVILAEPHVATEYSEANYTYVSYAYTDAPTYDGGTTESPTKKYTINFQDKESLFEYADGGGKKVNVFAYCNPPQTLVNYVLGLADATDKTFTDEIMSADIATTWNPNAFLMTSAKMHEVELPSQATLKSVHNSPATAFNLTKDAPIEVMRTAVRFDYKDGATAKDTEDKVIPYTYEIKDISDETKIQGTVTLTRAALFNLRNQFYYLPRTITTATGEGTTTATTNFCPDDIELGHVVSPDATAGRTYSEAITEDDFSNPLNPTTITGLKWLNLKGTTEDIDDGWTHPADPDGAKKLKEGYYIWRYATENTFASNATTFPRGETTGVVFEAEIKIDPAKLGGITIGTEPMYLYNGTIYANAEQLAKAAEIYPGSILAADFAKVFTVTGEGDSRTVALKDEYKDALEAEGFTIYRPKEGKYYCYYYYFNKHNDNEKPEVIAPFEFATVRNNVYKLSVTNIKKFGTFLPPSTIEDWDVYFSLDVQVRPWTVRVNDIEF